MTVKEQRMQEGIDRIEEMVARLSCNRESSCSVSETIAIKELLRHFVRKCARECKPGGRDYDKELAELCRTSAKLLGDKDPWR